MPWNTTPIVAQYHFGTTDASSAAYQTAANWVGVLFAVYNGVAALAALTLLPYLSRRIGQAGTHIAGLACGAIGYASFFLIRDPVQLVASEVFIGVFWASVLAMPYAILASSLQGKTSRANPKASAASAAAGTAATELGKAFGIPGLGRFARNLIGGLMR